MKDQEPKARGVAVTFLRFINKRNPGQILVLGFLTVIVLGSLLLMLPVATVDRTFLGPVDALFTATSAVCVTGLTVVNTGVTFSLYGQVVILALIQIGGLGFMTMTSLIFMAIGRRISLRERMIIKESFNSDSLQGMVRLVRSAIILTFSIEAAGAVILSLRLIPEFGFAKGLYTAVFFAVSGFCNAGFDVLGDPNSIERYAADPVINLVLMVLITMGGLGFSVLVDIGKNRRFGRLTLHSRIVLLMSGILFLFGTITICLLEWNNPSTLGGHDLNPAEKVMAAAFQSVTVRTAGFDTLGQAGLTPAGKMISMLLMFIGASPASTGGGIKTTTFFAVVLFIYSVVHQRQDYNVRHRRLNEQVVKRSLCIFSLALGLVLVGTLLVSSAETVAGDPIPLENVMFEVISAFGTVGLTANVTMGLCAFSKVVVTIIMFFGRLGPLTLSMALSGGSDRPNSIRYPEERMMVG